MIVNESKSNVETRLAPASIAAQCRRGRDSSIHRPCCWRVVRGDGVHFKQRLGSYACGVRVPACGTCERKLSALSFLFATAARWFFNEESEES